jgi:hypothetical protein
MASCDHLWNLTRPIEPASEVWDTIWNRLEQSLDQVPARTREVAESTPPAQSPHVPLRIAPISVAAENRSVRRPVEVQRGAASDFVPFWSGSRRERVLIAAAAILLLANVGFRALTAPSHRDGLQVAQVTLPGGPVAPLDAPPAIATVDIDEGQLVVIRSADPRLDDDPSVVVINRYEPDAGIDPFNGVVIDPWYLMFNIVESMTNPVVASLDLPGR